MKKIINIALSSIFALLLITSCDKEEAKISPEQEKEISTREMAFDKNPQDKNGAEHNAFLDYFGQHVDLSAEVNSDIIMNIVKGMHEKNNMEFGDEELYRYTSIIEDIKVQQIGGPATEYDPCKRYPGICDILDALQTQLPNQMLDESNGGTSTKRTLNFIEKLKADEIKIMADTKLSDEERKAALSFYSIARHSAAYWHNVAHVAKEKSPWFDSITAEQAAICHTCDVVAADAAGSIFGPWGAGIASAAVTIEKIFF